MRTPRLHPSLPLFDASNGDLLVLRDTTLQRFPPKQAAVVRRAAAHLRGHADRSPDPTDVAALRDAGLLIDADRLVHRHTGDELVARAVLSRTATDGPGADQAVRRRGVVVLVTSEPGLDPVVSPLREVLDGCGIETVRRRHQSHADRGVIAVHVGRPAPRELHRWMTAPSPHLVVVPRSSSLRVGPLVQPGATACLQCLHLARTDRFAGWPVLSEQLRHRTAPCPDPVLVWRAAAALAAELASFVEGDRCRLTGGYATVTRAEDRWRTVARHPSCGCWWPLARDATAGATRPHRALVSGTGCNGHDDAT